MKRGTSLKAPYLKKISLQPERADRKAFPFNTLKFLTDEFEMSFDRPITIFVGENGSGKSTLLEGIASLAGFHPYGGSHQHQVHRQYRPGDEDEIEDDEEERAPPGRTLMKALRPAWLPRISNGFFFRAESFFNVASYLDKVLEEAHDTAERGFLHQQSHGESFLSLFKEQLGGGRPSLYLLDEPEAALSPARQLAFICLMRRWEEEGNVQAIIATHAPMLMAYPGARLLEFRRGRIRNVEFEETEHFQVMRSFFADPQGYLEGIIVGEV